MIGAMGLEREEVYICNVLKSRPPRNRDPRPDEIRECIPFLKKQLAIIEPEVIVTLGRPASQQLLQTDQALGRMRGRWHSYENSAVMPTYHPAYLLHNESRDNKRKVWSDLQQVIDRLGLPGPDA
jgi:DNA polymerase